MVKLRDEMVQRQELESQLSALKQELQQTKEQAELWRKDNVEQFEEQINKAKAQVSFQLSSRFLTKALELRISYATYELEKRKGNRI